MRFVVALICLAATANCYAQNIRAERSILSGEAREMRREARALAASQRFNLLEEAAVKPKTTVDVAVGIAHAALDDQNAWNVPVQAIIGRTNEDWNIAVSTNGYETDRANHRSGWSDLKIKGLYALHIGGDQLVVGVGARAPTHGEIGSQAWQEELSAAYKAVRGQWDYKVGGAFKHNSKWSVDGVSANPKYGSASVGYNFDETQELSLLAERLYARGGAGLTTLSIVYDFQLSKSKKIDGEVTLAKGLTTADRSASIEFDILHRF